MKHLKYLLMAFVALCLTTSLHAQTTKKKIKAKKEKTAMHYQCPMKCEGEKTYHKNGKCPVCKMQMKPVKAIIALAKYQCPMKCEGDKVYTKEGRCPVCNMELKKVVAKKASDGHEGHNH